MASAMQKLWISSLSGVLFALVNLPQTYQLTDKLLGNQLFNSLTKCPTFTGLIVHTIVFFVLTFLSMWGSNINSLAKLNHTITATLVFFLLSTPFAYKLVGSLLGTWVADQNGCPTTEGVIVHAVVYTFIIFGLMYV